MSNGRHPNVCDCGSGVKAKKCKKRGHITPDQRKIDQINKIELQKAERMFETFKYFFVEKQKCILCGESRSVTSPDSSCLHLIWAETPIKKKKFELLIPAIEEQGFIGFNCFLRWIANIDKPFSNINDLRESANPIEETIVYKNIEWSFQASSGDIEGHEGKFSNFPHYHFQMKIDGRPFIGFSDYHLKLNDRDLAHLAAKNNPNVIYSNLYGAGMEEMLAAAKDNEKLLKSMTTEGDPDSATFGVVSWFVAKDGGKIDGNVLTDAFSSATSNKKTIASILNENTALKGEIYITPGPGVIQKSTRSKRRKNKRGLILSTNQFVGVQICIPFLHVF